MQSLWFSLQSSELRRAVVAMLLAFGLAQAIAGVYVLTFRGLSYSKSVVQGMAVGAVVPCMLMLAIGQNLAAGLGVAGGGREEGELGGEGLDEGEEVGVAALVDRHAVGVERGRATSALTGAVAAVGREWCGAFGQGVRSRETWRWW